MDVHANMQNKSKIYSENLKWSQLPWDRRRFENNMKVELQEKVCENFN
jgi:hypothetical protein